MSEKYKMKFYIAGPMRGIPRYNFPAFDRAKKILEDAGHSAVSPADLDRKSGFDAMALPENHDWHSIPTGFDFVLCVKRDLDAVINCDAIYLLRGWQKSMGARAEEALAEWMMKFVYRQEFDEEDFINEAKTRKSIASPNR